MFDRFGIMRALNRHVERVFNPDRKGHALGTAEAGAGSMRFVPQFGPKSFCPDTLIRASLFFPDPVKRMIVERGRDQQVR